MANAPAARAPVPWSESTLTLGRACLYALLHLNPIIAAVLNPIIGYDKAAEVVKKAREEKKTVRQVAVELGYLSAKEADRILDLGEMTGPGFTRKGI